MAGGARLGGAPGGGGGDGEHGRGGGREAGETREVRVGSGMAAVATVDAVLLAAYVAGCSSEAADQKVIDRLAQLEVLDVPAGATLMEQSKTKGGGADIVAIRGASSVTVVYASADSPARVGQAFHARFDTDWKLKDNGFTPLGGWAASGGLLTGPGTVATVEVRPASAGDSSPRWSRSIVTVTVSATRP